MKRKKNRNKESEKQCSLIKPELHCAIYSTFIPRFMCWKHFDMDKNLLHIDQVTKTKKEVSKETAQENLIFNFKNSFLHGLLAFIFST